VSVQFGEVRKSSGLDVAAKPFPGMIVPLGGSNIIKVFGAAGLSLFDDRGILAVKELDEKAVIMDKFLVYGWRGQMPVTTGARGPVPVYHRRQGAKAPAVCGCPA
jgi:hypothetical protein